MRKFRISPVSIVIWIWLVVVSGVLVAMSYFLAITIHELGHFVTAKRRGYKVSKFALSPYGVELSYFNQNIDFRDELVIAFAGPLANIISLLLVISWWWIFPSVYFFTESFVFVSLFIALFNLLPAYPLDGGRVFVCIASKFVSGKTAKKITMYANILIATFFFVCFVAIMFVNFNPSLLLFSIFLFAGILDLKFDSKYEKINVFSKEMKEFSKADVLCVSEEVRLCELISHLETSKTIVFCVMFENGKTINLSEKMVKNLALNFPYEIQLKEIFCKK